MLTKEEAKAALDNGDNLSIGSLWATKAGDDVYVNCYPDCNCSQDSYKSFDEFWELWGADFAKKGHVC